MRVEWTETSKYDLSRIIAERTPGGEWEFSEKSMWEVRWYPLPSSPELIEKAESLARGQYNVAA